MPTKNRHQFVLGQANTHHIRQQHNALVPGYRGIIASPWPLFQDPVVWNREIDGLAVVPDGVRPAPLLECGVAQLLGVLGLVDVLGCVMVDLSREGGRVRAKAKEPSSVVCPTSSEVLEGGIQKTMRNAHKALVEARFRPLSVFSSRD